MKKLNATQDACVIFNIYNHIERVLAKETVLLKSVKMVC